MEIPLNDPLRTIIVVGAAVAVAASKAGIATGANGGEALKIFYQAMCRGHFVDPLRC
jgi:hypothetical protein